MKTLSSIIKWATHCETTREGVTVSKDQISSMCGHRKTEYVVIFRMIISTKVSQFLSIFVGITDSTENSPYHFGPLRQPTQMLWHVRTYCLFSHQSYHRDSMNPKQNLQGKGRKWPMNGATWIHIGSARSLSFSLLLLDWNATVKTSIRYLIPTYFSKFLHFCKIKRQKDAISPQPSVLCACAGCHVTHSSGRRTTAFWNCAKIHTQLGNQTKFYHEKMIPLFNCIFSP